VPGWRTPLNADPLDGLRASARCAPSMRVRRWSSSTYSSACSSASSPTLATRWFGMAA